jgi:hypothetical protein
MLDFSTMSKEELHLARNRIIEAIKRKEEEEKAFILRYLKIDRGSVCRWLQTKFPTWSKDECVTYFLEKEKEVMFKADAAGAAKELDNLNEMKSSAMKIADQLVHVLTP